MRTDTTNYTNLANQDILHPRYVIALSFDDANTDITYLTSHDDCLDPGSVAAIDRIDGAIMPDGISGQSQRISPDRAQHTIGSVTFKILDVNGELSTKIKTKLDGGEGLRYKRIRLYKGWAGLTSWSDYTLWLTYRVENISYSAGVYTITTNDIQRAAKDKIFELHQGVLTSTITAAATTVPVTIADAQNQFPLVYHDDSWDAHINQAVGYIKIDDEIIAHSGWTDTNYNALQVVERGALGTQAVEHEVSETESDQKKKVEEYVYLQGIAPALVYGLYSGLNIPAPNLINDVAGFSEFSVVGSGVLSESNDAGPVSWSHWIDLIDDAAASTEYASYVLPAGVYVDNQTYTASIIIKHDATKTLDFAVYIDFIGASSFIYQSVNMSTKAASFGTTGSAVRVASSAILQNDYWFISITGYCSDVAATNCRLNIVPAAFSASNTQTIQAALPYFSIGQNPGMHPLPSHWHLGIHPDYIRQSDYTGIGADLWDTTTGTGRTARFMGIADETGKTFIEKELLQWMACYAPVHTDGALGLRRLKAALPYSAYDAYLDSTQITRVGDLKYDQSALINNIIIKWNWVDSLGRYTKTTQLADTDSASKYDTAPAKTYEFRGVFNGVHTDSDLQAYFQQIRDRYSAPPLRLSVSTMPQWDRLEVGDTVRINCGELWDYHIDDALDRVFEIQQIKTDWRTGSVLLDLFGSVEAGSEIAIAGTFVLADAFYGSGGQLGGTDLTTVLTISGGAVTANGSLSAGDYYYNGGDLTINTGVTVSISGTVRLRVMGFLTINGTIDGAGGGAAGGAGGTAPSGTYYGLPKNISPAHAAVAATKPAYGTVGGLGFTIPTPGLNINTNTASPGDYVITNYFGADASDYYPLTAQKQSADFLSVINPDGLNLQGLDAAAVLTGCGGAGGDASYAVGLNSSGGAFDYTFTPVATPGGTGGAGGAGLIIICRGMSFGASGKIDVSGAAGGTATSGTYNGDTYYSAPGCSGWPGAVYILIDGDSATPDRTKIITKTGNSTLPTASQYVTRDNFPFTTAATDSYSIGFFGSRAHDHPNNSHRDNVRIQYLPKALNGYTWFPAQEAQQVTGYGAKPVTWDNLADPAGTKPANNATVNNIYRTAAASAPSSPVSGDMWFQTDTGKLQTYDGAAWQPAATQNLVTRAGSAPSTPVTGDMWFNTSTGALQTYDGTDWQPAATQNLVTRAGSAPVSAIAGDMWFNTSTGALQTYDGTDWQPAATQNLVTRAASAPSTPNPGDMWFNTTDNIYQVYDGSDWQDVATVGATAGTNLRDSAASLIGDPDILNSYNVLTSAVTVTVGSGGDYSTINAALTGLTTQFPTYQSTAARATINILSGTQITEQVIVDGIDLSWVTITSVDATVTENISTLSGVSSVFSSSTYYPIIAAINGGKFPILKIKISTSSEFANKCGVLCSGGGSQVEFARGDYGVIRSTTPSIVVYGVFADGGGVVVGALTKIQNFYFNILADMGSSVYLQQPNLDGATSSALIARTGSKIVADGASIDNAGLFAVASTSGSQMSIINSTIDSPTDNAVRSDAGLIIAENVSVTNIPAGKVAFQVLNGGYISATNGTASTSQTANTITSSGLIIQ